MDLYGLARRINHKYGFDWYDPRTGERHPAPKKSTKKPKSKRK